MTKKITSQEVIFYCVGSDFRSPGDMGKQKGEAREKPAERKQKDRRKSQSRS